MCDHMLAIEHQLASAPAETATQLLAFCRRRLDAAEATVIAQRLENGTTTQQVEDLLTKDGKTSRRDAKKRVSRAKAVNANPDIANRMRTGNLSTEQADIIAEAAADTDGAAACDDTLLDDVASVTPEQGKKRADDYVTKTKTNDTIETEHARARRQRTVYRKRRRDGVHQLIISGDAHTIDQLETRIDEQADHEYRNDGGRDVPRDRHPRTRDQRRFDAAHTLITQTPTRSGSDDGEACGVAATSRRSTVFVKVTIDQLTGVDQSVITSCDGTRLPRSVLDELACHGDFIGQIFNQKGDLLWQGRATRYATPAQIRGLISRDGGCVLCHADHQRCVAHHRLPWEARVKGETDIDNLVFVCEACHRRIHNQHLTLVRNDNGDWSTRPAAPPEIAPPGGPPPKFRSGRHRHRSRDAKSGDKPNYFERRQQLYEQHQVEPLF